MGSAEVMAASSFTLSKLSELTGVKPSTIRYYLNLGLLPRPRAVTPNKFAYDERHLESIKLIKLLSKRRNITLAQIKKILPGLIGSSSGEAFLPEMWDELIEARLSPVLEKTPRNRLLKAAITELARHGFSEMSIENLCLTAKVPKGSFYRYFNSKDDLYFTVIAELTDKLSKKVMRLDVPAQNSIVRILSDEQIHPEDSSAVPNGIESSASLVEILMELCKPHTSILLDLLAQSSRKRHTAVRALSLFVSQLKKALEKRLLATDGLLLVDPEEIVLLVLARLAEEHVRITATPKRARQRLIND